MRYWLVMANAWRLTHKFSVRHRDATKTVVKTAGTDATVHVLASCLVAQGPRAVVRAKDEEQVRLFARRLMSHLTAQKIAGERWQPSTRICSIAPADVPAHIQRLYVWERASLGADVSMRRVKPGSKAAVRAAVRFLKIIASFNDQLLGKDENAARVRRYVTSHDMPADDRSAFLRLCDVILSQNVGFEAVEREREALCNAFREFEPEAVASLQIHEVGRQLSLPALRDPVKLRTCMSAATSWLSAAGKGSYVAQLARVAAEDDELLGWPQLVAKLQGDFAWIGPPMATAVLKRWGFFTATAHAGARRVLIRLSLVDNTASAMIMQAFLGRVAEASDSAPYAVEATLAIFAGSGPCRGNARCQECPLSARCPSTCVS